MTDYCTASDLYDHGLPRGMLPNPGRLVGDVQTSTEILTLDGHGFGAGDSLLFRAEDGGSLPAPLVSGTTYYALPLTDSTFQVAATVGGVAINLTTAGSRIIVVTPLPIGAAIAWASAMIDDWIPAHIVPMSAPFHTTVVAACAQLAAAKLLSYCGQSSATLGEVMTQTQRLLERWSKGIPLRGANVPGAASLAVVATAVLPIAGADPRGWNALDIFGRNTIP